MNGKGLLGSCWFGIVHDGAPLVQANTQESADRSCGVHMRLMWNACDIPIDVSNQLFGTRLLTSSCIRSWSWVCPFLFECARHDGHVLVAEAEIDRLLPFIGQARQCPEPAVCGLLGEAHIFESERQRELS